MGSATSLSKRSSEIQEMFGAVAPRYDLLNHLLSASLDRLWRRRAAAAVTPTEGPILDLCCGTGDQAVAIHRRGGEVVAADFCVPMLALAQRKYRKLDRRPPVGLAGDALELPFAGARFAGVTVSFGLRNVTDLDGALAEIQRVLEPGGRAAILEFTVPRNRLLRGIYLFYFRRVLPLVGRLISPSRSAYSYLPESVLEFPQREGFVERMERAGLTGGAWSDLSGGIVALYTAQRAP